MIIHLDRSTVEIDGQEFPACAAVCPVHPSSPNDTEADRMLGGPAVLPYGINPGRVAWQTMIPTENGVLIVVDWAEGQSTYTITIDAVTCGESQCNEETLWLPHWVALTGNRLTAWHVDRRGISRIGPWEWRGAEPDWAVGFIHRLSTLCYEPLPGPKMKLISLAESERLYYADHPHRA